MTSKQFYDSIKPGCSFEEFVKACQKFFDTQFRELGCQGVELTAEKWAPDDDTSPFFNLSKQVAHQIRKAFRYKPMGIKLMGSAEGPDLLMSDFYGKGGVFFGVLAEYEPGGTALRLMYLVGPNKVRVCYSFPEAYSEVDENGMGSGGSGQNRDYDFDLTDPSCVDGVFTCVAARIRDMLESPYPYRPSS